MRSLSFALFSWVALAVCGQTAPNQDCAHAIPLPVSSSNVAPWFIPLWGYDLTESLPTPVTACSGSDLRGMGWYSFVATATKLWLREEGDGLDESSLEVFSGSCGPLVSILCMPGHSNNVPLTGLTIGATYFVRVVMDIPLGNIMDLCFLSLAVVSDPTNDECAGAIELPVIADAVQPFPATEVCTLGATQSQAACAGNAAAANDDVWYRFTATESAHHFVTRKLTTPDLAIQWFGGACGALTSLACNTPHASGLVPGQEYHVRVHSTSTDPNVTVRVMAGVYSNAGYDECAGAIPLVVTSEQQEVQPVDLSTWLSTETTVPCGSLDHDVWLTFVAPTASVTIYSTESLNAALFDGSCGALNCIWQGIPLTPSWTLTGLTAGATYWLMVGEGSGNTNASVMAFSPVPNDECSNAVPLNVSEPGAVNDFTFGNFIGATESMPPCQSGQVRDVWYSFVAGSTQHKIEVKPELEISSASVEVFSGSCGSLVSIACSNNTYGLNVPGLVPGNTYYLRVYPVQPYEAAAFHVGITTPVPNDECDGAIELAFTTLEEYDAANNILQTDAQDGTTSCGGGALHDVWYKFTAAHASVGLLAPRSAGPVETVELLTGGCGALTSLGCVSWPEFAFMLTELNDLNPGTEYHLRVISGTTLPTQLLLFDQPVNDEISGALDVPVAGSPFAYPINETWNYGATQSYAPHCGAGAAPDEDTWFHFTATNGTHTILIDEGTIRFTTPDPVFPLRIEVYDTLSMDDAVLDANVVSCGNAPLVLTGLTAGHDYWYRAYTATQGTTSSCAFNTVVTAGDNDEATGALQLTYGDDYAMRFTTDGATQSMPGADCSVDDTADDDIWFTFTATSTPARLVAGYATTDVTIELFSGVPGNLVSVLCDGNILVLPVLTVGQAYFVRVYSWLNNVRAEGYIGLFTTPSLTANSCVDETCLGPVLLENPSIEQGEQCLPTYSDPNAAEGLGTLMAPGWPRLHGATCDGYSSCNSSNADMEVPSVGFSGPGFGRLVSRSGKGMAGIIALNGTDYDYREFIQATLTETLLPGEPYLVSFHIAERAGSSLSVNGFGAYLSQGPLACFGTDQAPDVVPQVRSFDVVQGGEWVNICGVVVPDAPWDNITIGVFLKTIQEMALLGSPYLNQAYYFIDDVVVARVTDPGCITGIGDVPQPDGTDDEGQSDGLHVYPNPANDRITIANATSVVGERAVIDVFDATGKRVQSAQVASLGALQQLDLAPELGAGLYLVMLRVEGRPVKSARVVVRR